MSEQNKRSMEFLWFGAKKFENDFPRLSDRHALLWTDEPLLTKNRAAHLVVFDQRPDIN